MRKLKFEINTQLPSQKRINTLLIILLPFIWTILMYYMLKKEPVVFDEEEQHKQTSHGFYESGKGIRGF